VPLQGGSVNSVYRVRSDLGLFVVRVNAPAAELLGINRAREPVLHSAASRVGLAPLIVHADPHERFLICEYVEGNSYREDDMADPAHLKQLAGWLRSLHAIAPPNLSTFDPLNLLQRHCERIARAEPGDAPRLHSWFQKAQGVLNACGSGERAPAIVHNDLHHSNLIQADRLYAVDWEYAAVADPLFDLACLLAYYPSAAPHAGLLLAESGFESTATRDLLSQLTWLFVLLSYLWYRVRRLDAPASRGDLAAEQALLQRL
jgi:thiamine kinase